MQVYLYSQKSIRTTFEGCLGGISIVAEGGAVIAFIHGPVRQRGSTRASQLGYSLVGLMLLLDWGVVFLAGSASCTFKFVVDFRHRPRCRVSTPQQHSIIHVSIVHDPSPPTSQILPLASLCMSAVPVSHHGSRKNRQDTPRQHHRRPLGSSATQGRQRQGGVSETHQPGSQGLTEPAHRPYGAS